MKKQDVEFSLKCRSIIRELINEADSSSNRAEKIESLMLASGASLLTLMKHNKEETREFETPETVLLTVALPKDKADEITNLLESLIQLSEEDSHVTQTTH